MKKRRKCCMKKFGLCVLIIALLCSMMACQKNGAVKIAKYTETDFTALNSSANDSMESIYNLCYTNNKLYYLKNRYNQSDETYSIQIKSADVDGNNETTIFAQDIPTQNTTVQGFSVDNANNVWILYDEFNESTETNADDMSQSMITYRIKEYDSNNNEIANINLSNIFTDSENFYISIFKVTSNGTICVSDGMKIYILDSTGTLKNSIDATYISDILLLGDTKILFSSYDADKFVLKEYDIEKNEIDKECKFEDNPSFIVTNNVDTVYVGSSTGISNYDLQKEKSTLLFKWSDMNINPSNISETLSLADGKFIIGQYGDDYSAGMTFKLLQQDENAPDDNRQIVTLGCTYMDYGLQKNIVDFNKTNTKYKIEFKDYSENNNDSNDLYTKLNTDIISGKSLDLIDISSIPDRTNYEQKNLLVDLNTYLDKDSDISKDDLVESIVSAYETNGKLYSIINSFMINTLAGSADKLGTTGTMTFAQVNERATNNNVTEIYDNIQSEVLKYALCTSQNFFINLDQKTCTFDSPEFKSVLEYASKFPSEFSDEHSVSDYKKFMDGNTLFLNANISSGPDYTIYKALAKEQLTFTGFPSMDDSGNIIYSSSELAVLDKSANKDGAWEFIKYTLSQEVQDNLDWSFPIRKTSLDEMLLNATKPQKSDDNNSGEGSTDESIIEGELYSYGGIVTDDGIEIEMRNITEDEIGIIKNLINSTKHTQHYDDKILEIIQDEAAAYFTGTKDVDSVASAIQSRAQVYISEQK